MGNCIVDVTLSTGHTLASITYTMGDAVFAHDTFMVPDSGTSRCDFPGGPSAEMWDTLQAILAQPGDHSDPSVRSDRKFYKTGL